MQIADIRLVPDKNRFVDISRRFNPKAFKEAANELTKASGHEVVEDALKRLRYLLAPKNQGGTQDIGATGKASTNFDVQMVDLGVGFVKWQIVEGNKTEANRYIREGIPAGFKTDRMKMFEWAKVRGIRLIHPAEYSGGGATGVATVSKFVGASEQRSKKGNIYKRRGYIRSRYVAKTDARFTPKQITHAALNAISFTILNEGTERERANWFDKWPSGQGRFDYIVFNFLRNREYYERSAERAAGTLAGAVIEYIGSGKIRKRSGTLRVGSAYFQE